MSYASAVRAVSATATCAASTAQGSKPGRTTLQRVERQRRDGNGHLRPAQVDRLAPLQSAARSRSQWRHTGLASRLIGVFSGVYSWFHLQCVFGVLWESGEGGKW